MSDTDEKEAKPVAEDLRRSKRKKFTLDVVTLLNRRSPDFRRIDNKTDAANKSPLKPKPPNNGCHSLPILEPICPSVADKDQLQTEDVSHRCFGWSMLFVGW